MKRTPTTDERRRMCALFFAGAKVPAIAEQLGFKPVQVHRVLLGNDAYRSGARW